MTLNGDFTVEHIAVGSLDEQEYSVGGVEGAVTAAGLRCEIAVELVEVSGRDGGLAVVVD